MKDSNAVSLFSLSDQHCQVVQGSLFSSRNNAGVISTTSACSQSLEAICWPDTPALSQLNDNVNTEGKKRCSIVLHRLKGWPGSRTPCPSESSLLVPLNGH